MALTSLFCSLLLLTSIVVFPEKYAVFAETRNHRPIDPSMLKATLDATTFPQQQIQAIIATTEPPTEDATVPSQVVELIKNQKGEIVPGVVAISGVGSSDGVDQFQEEETEWEEEHQRRRPRKHKSRRQGIVLDPRKTWQAFLRHTERQQSREKKRPHKKVKSAQLRHGGSSEDRNENQASRSDSNPFSSGMTRQQMIEHMRELIRDAAERRLSQIQTICANSSSADCNERSNPIGSPLFEIERAALIPETHSAFTWRLSHKIKIRKQRETEIKGFYRPYISGAFERGDGLHSEEGRFKAPTSGIFIFNVHLHFNISNNVPSSIPTKLSANHQGFVILRLCIEANCTANYGLSAIRAIHPSENLFTMHLSGPVHLEAGQSVSLFVANKAKSSAIRILEDSTFSGYLSSYY